MQAVADGSLIAHVYENGREIGTATLVLPVFGVSEQMSIEITGIGLEDADKDKKHTVTFSATNLWLMER